ncbi:MAG TPA: DNA-directed RNA polymerase [Candidatus Omnitrophota bacterium]|nr:DNA-directed RNA polymerase [Candidatus Omnitrophota bacterium]
MGFRQEGFGERPREMHKAICADCHKECEVPFKPSSGRPVYCKDCFSKRKEQGR